MHTVHTIGHSTRTLEELVALLSAHHVDAIIDVRRYPGSRRFPHFAKDALAKELPRVGIEYRHVLELGGRRKARKDSLNTAWRSESFRSYADYMATDEFARGLKVVLEEAQRRRSAILCAEAVPWRCHRQLIADVLVARGIEVVHIIGEGQSRQHVLNAAAQATTEGYLVYP